MAREEISEGQRYLHRRNQLSSLTSTVKALGVSISGL